MGNSCTSMHSAASQPGSPKEGGSSSTAVETVERRQQREREAGQQQLRDMVAAADANGLALDWSALIKKAEELHRKDQEYERKRRRLVKKRPATRRRKRGQQSGQGGDDGSISGGGSVSSRLQQNLERRRRRRADACGSFSVNLMTYRNETEVPLLRSSQASSKDGGGGGGGSQATSEDLSGSGALDQSTITASTAPGMDEECCSRSFDSGGAGSLGLSDHLHNYGVIEGLETILE